MRGHIFLFIIYYFLNKKIPPPDLCHPVAKVKQKYYPPLTPHFSGGKILRDHYPPLQWGKF
jgi:hypothetical protein